MKIRLPSLTRQRGLSLIESLVALVLTLALIAGVAQMLFGTQANIRNQNDRASMDDEARFAIEYLSRAGYRAGFVRNPDDSTDDAFPVSGTFALGAVVVGTDTSLSLRYQGHADAQMTNCLNDKADVETSFYVETWSVVGSSLRCTLTLPGAPANTEALMNNVEAISLRYGVDTNGDRYPDEYRSAGAIINWAEVRSVEVSLRMVSTNDNLAETPQPYVGFAGAPVMPNDRRLRRNVFTTIALRNSLP